MNATTHIFCIVIVTYVMLLSDSSLEGISVLQLFMYSSHAEPEEHFVHTSGVMIDPDLDPTWFIFQDKSDI